MTTVLDFVREALPPRTVLGFDSCTPLMLAPNDQIPGIAFNIERLAEIGEPYLFGLFADEMETWLTQKGFRDIDVRGQSKLQRKYFGKDTLPRKMWYVVTAVS